MHDFTRKTTPFKRHLTSFSRFIYSDCEIQVKPKHMLASKQIWDTYITCNFFIVLHHLLIISVYIENLTNTLGSCVSLCITRKKYMALSDNYKYHQNELLLILNNRVHVLRPVLYTFPMVLYFPLFSKP